MKEHRRLWKMITLAEQHWPEQFEFQPEGKDYIRQWLTVKAGQYTFERHDVPPKESPLYDGIISLMRSAYNFTALSDAERPRYVFEKITGPTQITLYQAKSWAKDSMTQAEFHHMGERISLEILPNIIGQTGNELLEAYERGTPKSTPSGYDDTPV